MPDIPVKVGITGPIHLAEADLAEALTAVDADDLEGTVRELAQAIERLTQALKNAASFINK